MKKLKIITLTLIFFQINISYAKYHLVSENISLLKHAGIYNSFKYLTNTSSLDNNSFDQNDKRLEENHVESNSFFSINFWLVFFGICIIILFIAVFILFKKNKVLEILDKKTNEKLKYISAPTSNILQYKNDGEFLKIQQRFNQLENTVKAFTTKDRPLFQPESEMIQTPIELQVPRVPEADEVFYMATPDLMRFNMQSKSNEFKPTQSLYKFTVDRYDKNKAFFRFYSDDTGISIAVNAPQLYINQVCDAVNDLNQNAKKITTETPGVAHKNQGFWEVTTKAKIKYE